jgi:hypothetical protein
MKLSCLPILVPYALAICTLSCEKPKSLPAVPEAKQSFARQVFTAAGSDTTLTLVSEKECEIENLDGSISLAEYSRQGDKLRVVQRSPLGDRVSYYRIWKFGFRDPDSNRTFLSAEALAAVHSQLSKPLLGASEAELAERFGQPTSSSGDAHERSCYYAGNGFYALIHADFLDGHADYLTLETHEDTGWEQLDKILQASADGKQWKVTARSAERTEYRRSDGAIAFYNVPGKNPPRVLAFETADHSKRWQERIRRSNQR